MGYNAFMRSRTRFLALGTVVFALTVTVYGAGDPRKHHTITPADQARREIQKIYNSPLYAPMNADSGTAGTGTPIPKNPIPQPLPLDQGETRKFAESRAIQKFSLQGDTAIVVVKYEQRYVDTLPALGLSARHVLRNVNRDIWKKMGNKWTSVATRVLTADAYLDGENVAHYP